MPTLRSQVRSHRLPAAFAAAVVSTALLSACAATGPRDPYAAGAGSPEERRVAARFEALRNSPQEQWAFLKTMPKGGDLHSHLSGAVYAESFIDWAVEAGLCLDTTMTVIAPPCDSTKALRPVKDAYADEGLRRDIIDAWSTRNLAVSGHTGHQQFFDTFGKFSLAGRGHRGRMLAEVVERAASGGCSTWS